MTKGSTLVERCSIGTASHRIRSGVRVLGWLGVVMLLFVGLMGGTSSTGMLAVAQADATEPNDSFDTATPLSPPVDRDGLMTSAEDHDFYAVDLDRGTRLNVSVVPETRETDTDLLVFDPNRNQLASRASTEGTERLSFQAPLNGTYFLVVISWSSTEQPYSLSATASDEALPANDALEYNNGFDSASEISHPFERSDLRIVGDDSDIFALRLTADTRLTAVIRFSHDEANLDLRLYNESRTLIASSTSITANESLSTPIEDAGRYYLEVFSPTHGTAGYSLTTSVVTGGSGSGPPTTVPAEGVSLATETPVPTTLPSTATTAADTLLDGTVHLEVDQPGFGVVVALVGIGLGAWLYDRRKPS